jgi:uncharacterized PurR-regulated membrane protein YhhQ (DUF165 family)
LKYLIVSCNIGLLASLIVITCIHYIEIHEKHTQTTSLMSITLNVITIVIASARSFIIIQESRNK